MVENIWTEISTCSPFFATAGVSLLPKECAWQASLGYQGSARCQQLWHNWTHAVTSASLLMSMWRAKSRVLAITPNCVHIPYLISGHVRKASANERILYLQMGSGMMALHWHYCDVTWATWRHRSPATRLFVQRHIQHTPFPINLTRAFNRQVDGRLTARSQKSRSREIRFPIALKFDRHLSSSTAMMPGNFAGIRSS